MNTIVGMGLVYLGIIAFLGAAASVYTSIADRWSRSKVILPERKTQSSSPEFGQETSFQTSEDVWGDVEWTWGRMVDRHSAVPTEEAQDASERPEV